MFANSCKLYYFWREVAVAKQDKCKRKGSLLLQVTFSVISSRAI